jgi:hypothetical protein
MKVTQEQALQLELKINLSPYGRSWKTLGDSFYNFFKNPYVNLNTDVTPQQYDYLQRELIP